VNDVATNDVARFRKRRCFLGVGFFFTAIAVGLSSGVSAAPPPEARCEWVDCAKNGDAAAASTPVEPERTPLPECGSEDRFVCGERCRTEFDDAHRRCRDRCLGERCVEPVAPGGGDGGLPSGRSGGTDLCIEGESAECGATCESEAAPERRARCRLACLVRLCPGSNRADIADEAASPGAARCRRCRERESRNCARSCRVGIAAGTNGSFSGLGAFGCEKACLAAACGTGCVF